jgi:hypothetical protein
VVKQKLKEWGKRYLPGEIVGTITAVAAASIAHIYYENLIFIAYVGSIGEAVGFYSTVLVQNLIRVNQDCRKENRNFKVSDFRKIVSRIALEFGPAGIIDDLLVRPFFMYWFPLLLNNFMLGILIGKFVGDFAFYILVILSYELNKSYKKTKWSKN